MPQKMYGAAHERIWEFKLIGGADLTSQTEPYDPAPGT